ASRWKTYRYAKTTSARLSPPTSTTSTPRHGRARDAPADSRGPARRAALARGSREGARRIAVVVVRLGPRGRAALRSQRQGAARPRRRAGTGDRETLRKVGRVTARRATVTVDKGPSDAGTSPARGIDLQGGRHMPKPSPGIRRLHSTGCAAKTDD